VESLPCHHRDPFDRLLIAAAMTEQMPVLTADENFLLYDIRCVW
jgi:PIN domain nuclease of toxin-antitoxin system